MDKGLHENIENKKLNNIGTLRGMHSGFAS